MSEIMKVPLYWWDLTKCVWTRVAFPSQIRVPFPNRASGHAMFVLTGKVLAWTHQGGGQDQQLWQQCLSRAQQEQDYSHLRNPLLKEVSNIFDSHEKMQAYLMISVKRPSVRACQKLWHCNSFEHYRYCKCETVHDGNTRWALSIHNTWVCLKVTAVWKF